MKRLLSVGAITLALTFSAYAEAPDHVAFMPDFYMLRGSALWGV
jgi:hypothetical protein